MKRQSILKHFLIIVLLHIGICKIHATNDYDKLINAIAHVESKHNEKLVSKNKTHVGLLQISKITVDECNRIIGMKKYTYQDRYDRNKSIEMFLLSKIFIIKKAILKKQSGYGTEDRDIPKLRRMHILIKLFGVLDKFN